MQLSRGQLVLIISPKVRTRSILTVKPTFRFPPYCRTLEPLKGSPVSGPADLALGRPRPDRQQTTLIATIWNPNNHRR